MREGSQALFGLFRIWWREEKCVISTKSEGKWWCSTRTRRREMNRMRYIRCLTFPRIQAGFLLWACHTFPALDQSAQAEVFTCCNLFSLNCSFENWSHIARYMLESKQLDLFQALEDALPLIQEAYPALGFEELLRRRDFKKKERSCPKALRKTVICMTENLHRHIAYNRINVSLL